jgi:hypothetical protein
MNEAKAKWRSWLGQSITDKMVTGGIALVSVLAVSISRAVSSEGLEYLLLFASIAGAFVLVVVLYLNRRLAKIEAQQQHSENLHAVNGFIVRHRIHEAPRTVLDRHVQFADPADRERAVESTLNAHRTEILDLIREANPELSTKAIEELLEVFYGAVNSGTSNGRDNPNSGENK